MALTNPLVKLKMLHADLKHWLSGTDMVQGVALVGEDGEQSGTASNPIPITVNRPRGLTPE